ncbi:MAG TPA: fibronectin type III domain-containing protein [Acidimicrobiales bacterium]|nr:fibronectin type III domain-containing protein [Acidimicrobiales bacterium]
MRSDPRNGRKVRGLRPGGMEMGWRRLAARWSALAGAAALIGTAAAVPVLLAGAPPAAAAVPVGTVVTLGTSALGVAENQNVTFTATTEGSIFGTQVQPNTLSTLVPSGGLSGPQMIAFDAGGNLYSANSSSNRVSVLPAASGTLFGVSVTAGTNTTLISSGLSGPTGIAVGPAGDLYVSNNSSGTVSVLPASTKTLFGQSVTADVLTTVVSGLSSPEGIALDTQGDLFIAERGGSLAVLPAVTGTLFGTAVTAGSLTTFGYTLSTPFNLAFDQAGNLYIANQGTSSVLVLPVSSGSLYGVSVTAGTLATVASGINTPVGMAFDAAGDLFISGWGSSLITVVPGVSGTVFGQSVVAGTATTLGLAPSLNGPTGLATDANGDLYIAEYTGNDLLVLPTVMGVLPASGETIDFEDGGAPIPGCGAKEMATTWPYGATCTTSFSSPGDHSITAVYSGDSTFSGSTSPTLVQAVYGTLLYAFAGGAGTSNCFASVSQCSLAAALSEAVASGDTIDLAAGTYALGGTIAITQPGTLTIQTDGSGPVLIDGGGTYRVLSVASGSDLVLNGVTIQNGASSSGGAGIYNQGTLTLDAVTVQGNTDSTSVSAQAGAGLSNAGQATIVNSTFSNNNESNNSWGGAIANQAGATLTISGSTFSANHASGACACGAAGAIANFGTASINNSTFYGNGTNGSDGGAIETQGPLTLVQDTFAGGNTSSNHSSGGGDVFDQAGATVYAAGDLFGDTATDPCYVQTGATWQDGGYNAAGPGTQCLGAASDVADANLAGDLGALANNGGLTLTVKPQAGAPEIGAIPDPANVTLAGNPVALCPEGDQTGSPSLDGTCTIGSVFVTAAPGAPTGLTAVPVAGGVSLSWAPPLSNGATTVTGYDVYVGTSSGTEAPTPVNASPVGVNSYVVSGLGASAPYYFTVAAVGPAGISSPSLEASATPLPVPVTTTTAPTPVTSAPPSGATSTTTTSPGAATPTTALLTTTVPTTTVPTTTVPATTVPATTVPTTTVPTTTVPTTTVPRTTVPATTGRVTTTTAGVTRHKPTSKRQSTTTSTAPAATTVPATTVPATTVPPTTTPATTLPATTGPASAAPSGSGPTTTGAGTAGPAATVLTTTAPANLPVNTGTQMAAAATTTTTAQPVPARGVVPLAAGSTTVPGSGGASHGAYHTKRFHFRFSRDQGHRTALVISFDFGVGERVYGRMVTVTGNGLAPGTFATITLHSVPLRLGTARVALNGAFSTSVRIPQGIALGAHHIEVSGRSPTQKSVDAWRYFELGGSGIATRLQTSGPPTAVPAWATEKGPQPQVLNGVVVQPFVAAQHAKSVIRTEIGGVVVLGLVAAGGAGLASGLSQGAGSGAASEHKSKKMGKIGSASFKHGALTEAEKRRGDKSRTWQWPGVAVLDRLSRSLPERLGARSPLLARIVADGASLRAVFGTASLVVPLAGMVLGVFAALSVGGYAMPPSFGYLAAIIVLGVFDALAGALAALVFLIGVTAAGGVGSWADVRMMLAVCVLMFVAPLTASKARALRRKMATGPSYWFDRAGDLAIAALLAAYGVEKLVGGLKPLSSLQLPVASDGAKVALTVLAAVVVRYGIETAVVHWYPYRLAEISSEEIPSPGQLHTHFVTLFQTALFIFVAYPVLGGAWELYAGALLFWGGIMLSIAEDKLPDVPWVKRLSSKGYVKSVVTIVIGSVTAAIVSALLPSATEQLTLGFLIFMVPGLVLTVLGGLGRHGKKLALTWPSRAAGTIVLAVGVLLAQGIVTINL